MMFPAEGAPKESGETFFRDIMVLDDVISELAKELREAGRRVTMEWKTIEGKERRETEGQWNTAADVMVENFKDSQASSLSFQCAGSIFLKKKGGRCTIHFRGDPSNAELSFRTMNSASQLSFHGAVADWLSRFLVSHFNH